MAAQSLYDFTPLLRMALFGVVLALGPLAWVWLRHRGAQPGARLHALSWLTVFLTFDLVLFGAFTRLTDSGLGCPDWPGCYGSASPLGARDHIEAAQATMPTGPVTHGKAWIEMVHRYLATGVGVLITVLAIASWMQARRQRAAVSPWWATAAWVWVCVQGAFGALTVTMKLYPAVVTAHLLGGLGLIVLLVAQSEAHGRLPLALSRSTVAGTALVFGLSVVQIALGGWVSTNYAVLACSDFPTCQGSWWPHMDFEHGFTVLRELGTGRDGASIPFEALTAIHMVHRIGAIVVLTAIVLLARRLLRQGDAAQRRFAFGLLGVAAWQFATGLGNVMLGWPLLAAVAHTAGAAALLALLTAMLARARLVARQPRPDAAVARVPAAASPTRACP